MGDKLKYGYGASALSRILVLFLVVVVMCAGCYWIGIEFIEHSQENTTKMIGNPRAKSAKLRISEKV